MPAELATVQPSGLLASVIHVVHMWIEEYTPQTAFVLSAARTSWPMNSQFAVLLARHAHFGSGFVSTSNQIAPYCVPVALRLAISCSTCDDAERPKEHGNLRRAGRAGARGQLGASE